MDVVTKFRDNSAILLYVETVIDHVLIKGLKADATVINVSDVEHFFENEGEPIDATPIILDHIDLALSKKLDADEKMRVMTFIRGFQLGTTTAEIKAALVSILWYLKIDEDFY